MILTPAFSLLPMVIKSHFKGGATELGWVEGAFGLGIVAGGLLLSIWGGFKRNLQGRVAAGCCQPAAP
jgi:DHA3 family macrolide efflux protein-like MFS transporter